MFIILVGLLISFSIVASVCLCSHRLIMGTQLYWFLNVMAAFPAVATMATVLHEPQYGVSSIHLIAAMIIMIILSYYIDFKINIIVIVSIMSLMSVRSALETFTMAVLAIISAAIVKISYDSLIRRINERRISFRNNFLGDVKSAESGFYIIGEDGHLFKR